VGIISTPPPAAPTALLATATSATQVGVTWNTAAGANGYDIYRKEAGQPFTFLANRTSPPYTDNSVTPDTAYLYRIRAVGVGGESPFSNTDLATTIIYTDGSLVLYTTPVKTVHRDQLRTAVIAVEALAGTTFIFGSSDPKILSDDITIIRLVLGMARNTLGLPALSYTHSANVGTPIAAIDFQELRDGMK
jgi:fibronectin type 3 domain-containing protein